MTEVRPISLKMGGIMIKPIFCHMRTTKAQISLRIHAVWSAPLLFAAWTVTNLYSSKLSVCALHVRLFNSKFHVLCRRGYVWMYVYQHFQTSSPLKPLGRLKPPWDGGTKVCSNSPGHMTKMADMPIYGKNRKNILLRNKRTDDFETWNAASGARVLPTVFKWWRWVDLDLFYGNINFGPLCFFIGKG